jgi:hypothetical protein
MSVDDGYTDWFETEHVRHVRERLWVRYCLSVKTQLPDKQTEWRAEASELLDQTPTPIGWQLVKLVWWAIVCICMGMIFMKAARAEFCYTAPNNPEVEKLDGHRWHWRNVENKKCWYYAPRIRPVTDLIWKFDENEFNSDVDRIIERKFEERFFAPVPKDAERFTGEGVNRKPSTPTAPTE